MDESSTDAAAATVDETASVDIGHREPVPTATVDDLATVVKSSVPKILVEEKSGYLKIPNTIFYNLLPRLSERDQIVYLRLFALTHGFQRDECTIGHEKLAEAGNMSKRNAQRAVDSLESLGLITRLTSTLGGDRAARGSRYRVMIPTVANLATLAKLATVDGSSTGVGMSDMKENQRKEKEKSVLSFEEQEAIKSAASHKVAIERVPGHLDNLRNLFGDVMPWEAGYVPLAARKPA